MKDHWPSVFYPFYIREEWKVVHLAGDGTNVGEIFFFCVSPTLFIIYSKASNANVYVKWSLQ